jgi:hypothetical protein
MFLLAQLVMATDPVPSDNDVKAGWGALGLLLLLIAAVIFLFFSFSKQLKKVEAANDAGVYDDDKGAKQSSTDDA